MCWNVYEPLFTRQLLEMLVTSVKEVHQYTTKPMSLCVLTYLVLVLAVMV